MVNARHRWAMLTPLRIGEEVPVKVWERAWLEKCGGDGAKASNREMLPILVCLCWKIRLIFWRSVKPEILMSWKNKIWRVSGFQIMVGLLQHSQLILKSIQIMVISSTLEWVCQIWQSCVQQKIWRKSVKLSSD